jgi:hypothetical protein
MFSVVDGVLLRALPYPNAGRIVAINTSWPQKAKTIPRVTGPDIVDVRSGADVFDHLRSYYGGEVGVQLPNHAEFVGTMWVTPDFFSVFGTTPAYGRFFQEDDAKRSAVVSLAFATRNFATGPGALGKALHIEGVEYDIVGVLPASFHFPDQTQVWPAIPNEPEAAWSNRTAFNYHAVASLKPARQYKQRTRSCEPSERGCKRRIRQRTKTRLFWPSPCASNWWEARARHSIF